MAELADAQVSEACDGDIVEVQVLSSAPVIKKAANSAAFFYEYALTVTNLKPKHDLVYAFRNVF